MQMYIVRMLASKEKCYIFVIAYTWSLVIVEYVVFNYGIQFVLLPPTWSKPSIFLYLNITYVFDVDSLMY